MAKELKVMLTDDEMALVRAAMGREDIKTMRAWAYRVILAAARRSAREGGNDT